MVGEGRMAFGVPLLLQLLQPPEQRERRLDRIDAAARAHHVRRPAQHLDGEPQDADLRVQEAKAAAERRLARSAEADPRLKGVRYAVRYAGLQAEPLLVDTGHPMIGALSAAHERVFGGAPRLLASSATTDARFFNLYGSTPATCYGPEATDIHGIDESVSLASTLRVSMVLALFIARWCGLERV